MRGVRILIAGIGNIFFGDDAFGVEVAKRLAMREWPAGVTARDFGIRGMDLGYALLENYDAVILIDATRRAGAPGTLYVIEPKMDELVSRNSQELLVETHSMIPEKVLGWAQAMGARLPNVRVVGCEPATLGSEDDMLMGLSEPVQAAVDEAVRIVEQLVDEILEPGYKLVM